MVTEASVDRTDPRRPVLLLTRHLPHSVERVWRSLIDSEEASRWFPCRVEIEPREGGVISFIFDGEAPEISHVSEFDPPHALAYEWSGEHLRWTVEADGDGCILRLSNTIVDPDSVPRTAAGWDTCLEDLRALLDGEAGAERSGVDEAKIAHYRAELA
ncbi:SRPBCC family protein [Microbacterium sp. LWH11-1.2]|uniref:SRPBCC family protein n=1 Tax=Microbacterium sp. LWH11-1.2 TaxID=3135258 RepID=UPI00313982C0